MNISEFLDIYCVVFMELMFILKNLIKVGNLFI